MGNPGLPASVMAADDAHLARMAGDGERKSFKDCYYDNYHAVGVSLSFDIDKDGGELLGAIHVYPVPVDGHQACPMRLPHELHTTRSAKEVVTLLGEPGVKSGGRIQELSISYEGIGVQIDFCGMDWDDAGNIIKCVTFFEEC